MPFLTSSGQASHSSLPLLLLPLSVTLVSRSSRTQTNGSRQKYTCSITNCIQAANGSAAGLVNLLADDFSCFRDEFRWQGRRKPIRFLKRPQILVADLWACFQGESYGSFRDIDKITMFADYRVPQILSTLGCLSYSPPLAAAVKEKEVISSGSNWEMQLRGEFFVFRHGCVSGE